MIHQAMAKHMVAQGLKGPPKSFASLAAGSSYWVPATQCLVSKAAAVQDTGGGWAASWLKAGGQVSRL